jgi:hypothetical protein
MTVRAAPAGQQAVAEPEAMTGRSVQRFSTTTDETVTIRARLAAEVGKFANCLERLDYGADLYALLHQVDFLAR